MASFAHTAEEEARLTAMLKDPEARAEFIRFMKEIEDPQTRAENEAYMSQLEAEGAVPSGKRLIRPAAAAVLGLTFQGGPNGDFEAFANLVTSDVVGKSGLKKDPSSGKLIVTLPNILGPLRQEPLPAAFRTRKAPGKAARILVCDFCVHPATVELMSRSVPVREAVHQQVGDAVAAAVAAQVQLPSLRYLRCVAIPATVLQHIGGSNGTPATMLTSATDVAASQASKAVPPAAATAAPPAPVAARASASAPVASPPVTTAAPAVPAAAMAAPAKGKGTTKPSSAAPSAASAVEAAPSVNLPKSPTGALLVTPRVTALRRARPGSQVTATHPSLEQGAPAVRSLPEELLVLRVHLPGVTTVSQLEVDLTATALKLSSCDVKIASSAQAQGGGSAAVSRPPHVHLTHARGDPAAVITSIHGTGVSPEECTADASGGSAAPGTGDTLLCIDIPTTGLLVSFSLDFSLPCGVDPDANVSARFIVEKSTLEVLARTRASTATAQAHAAAKAAATSQPTQPTQPSPGSAENDSDGAGGPVAAPAPSAPPTLPAAALSDEHSRWVKSRVTATTHDQSSVPSRPAAGVSAGGVGQLPGGGAATTGPAHTPSVAASGTFSTSASRDEWCAPPEWDAAGVVISDGGEPPFRWQQSSSSVSVIFDVPHVVPVSMRVEHVHAPVSGAGSAALVVSFVAAGRPLSSTQTASGVLPRIPQPTAPMPAKTGTGSSSGTAEAPQAYANTAFRYRIQLSLFGPVVTDAAETRVSVATANVLVALRKVAGSSQTWPSLIRGTSSAEGSAGSPSNASSQPSVSAAATPSVDHGHDGIRVSGRSAESMDAASARPARVSKSLHAAAPRTSEAVPLPEQKEGPACEPEEESVTVIEADAHGVFRI